MPRAEGAPAGVGVGGHGACFRKPAHAHLINPALYLWRGWNKLHV